MKAQTIFTKCSVKLSPQRIDWSSKSAICNFVITGLSKTLLLEIEAVHTVHPMQRIAESVVVGDTDLPMSALFPPRLLDQDSWTEIL